MIPVVLEPRDKGDSHEIEGVAVSHLQMPKPSRQIFYLLVPEPGTRTGKCSRQDQ